jgi:hypothetical protein
MFQSTQTPTQVSLTESPREELKQLLSQVTQLRGTIAAVTYRGNTTTLVRGIKAQEEPMVLVAGGHNCSASIARAYEVKTTCLNHVVDAMEGLDAGLVFDNSAVDVILMNIEAVAKAILAEDTDKQPATNDGAAEKKADELLDFVLAQSIAMLTTMEQKLDKLQILNDHLTTGVTKINNELELETDLNQKLEEQIEVLTRALRDAQNRISDSINY